MAAVNPQVFDSSGLQSIAAAMPDVVGSTANAYKLKDMSDTSQINTLQLSEMKSQVEQKQAVQDAMKGLPVNATNEQRMQAVETVAKDPRGGYQGAMALSRQFQTESKAAKDAAEQELRIREHLGRISDQEYQVYQTKVDTFENQFVPVQRKFEELVSNGMPIAQAKAAVQPMYQNAYFNAVNAKDAGGAPVYGDPQSQSKFQALTPTFDPDKLLPEINNSEKARKFLLDAQKERTSERREGAFERGLTMRERSANVGGLDPSTIKSMAERVVVGGEPLTAVAGRLGSGTQGRRDLRDLQNEIARISAERGVGAGGIVAQRQETAAQGKASQVAGAQAGKVAVGLAEVRQFGPLAIQASDAIPRGNFTPLTRLTQLGESKISDVNQKVFLVRHQAFLNAYNLVASRAGISATDRDHNRSLLEMADSPEAYKAGAQAMMFEAEKAEQAAQSAMKVPRAGASASAAPASGGANSVDKAGYDALPKGARYTMPGDPTVRVKQ